jgi:hypothetical protein
MHSGLIALRAKSDRCHDTRAELWANMPEGEALTLVADKTDGACSDFEIFEKSASGGIECVGFGLKSA